MEINTHLKGKKLSRKEYIAAMAFEYERRAKIFAQQGDFEDVAEKHIKSEEDRTGVLFGSDECHWTEEAANEEVELHFLDFTKTKFIHNKYDLLQAYFSNQILN